MKDQSLLSWGRYPRFPQTARACHWRDELRDCLAEARREYGTTLAYGSGLSYGDSCLAASDHVLDCRPLDRFIQADWDSGVVKAEAGCTLEQVLAQAIPRGWFLPVTPGTKYVTLGGAIANDVHGKNHHRCGTFGRHVTSMGLLRSDVGSVTCSGDRNAELFAATIGGLGLTGLVEWAEIKLTPIAASQIEGLTRRFDNLDEYFALSKELDPAHEFSVSWVDCAAKGSRTGRGVYMAGDFAKTGSLTVERRRRVVVPATPPVPIVNGLALRAFNEVFWRKHPPRGSKRMGYEPFFYPLDAVLKWNRIYGKKGFQQYQCCIPEADSRPALRELLSTIAAAGTGSFLAVLKRFGDVASPGLLSFPRPGMTLALDFPQSDRLSNSLFPRLDAIVREAGGRLYPAKDAHMSGEDFRRAYPDWIKVEAQRDPVLCSRFWRRVTS